MRREANHRLTSAHGATFAIDANTEALGGRQSVDDVLGQAIVCQLTDPALERTNAYLSAALLRRRRYVVVIEDRLR